MLSSGAVCDLANAAGHSVDRMTLTAVEVGFATGERGVRISVSASLSLVIVSDG
jgi:hypothetical protein